MAKTPTQVVNAFVQAFAVRDYDTALGLIAPDCEYSTMPEGMPKVRGLEGVRAVLEPLLARALENEFIILGQLAEGPLLFSERLDRDRLGRTAGDRRFWSA